MSKQSKAAKNGPNSATSYSVNMFSDRVPSASLYEIGSATDEMLLMKFARMSSGSFANGQWPTRGEPIHSLNFPHESIYPSIHEIRFGSSKLAQAFWTIKIFERPLYYHRQRQRQQRHTNIKSCFYCISLMTFKADIEISLNIELKLSVRCTDACARLLRTGMRSYCTALNVCVCWFESHTNIVSEWDANIRADSYREFTHKN